MDIVGTIVAKPLITCKQEPVHDSGSMKVYFYCTVH